MPEGWSRSTLAAVLLVVAALGAACSNETGVLVRVDRDPSTTPADITRLQFLIGLTSADHPDTFLLDDASISDVSVSGRDLRTSPFQLLVREPARSDAKILLAVLAFRGDDVVGFAGFDTPQGFIDGQVLLRELTLATDPSAEVSPTGCMIWYDREDRRREIASLTDQDCDGDTAEVDCNDHDDAVGPSRTEVCENGVDDNCTGGVDEVTDDDADGVTNCAGDCDDDDPMTFTGAPEICDDKDNDCNEACDDGVLDGDGDGYNVCGSRIVDGACVNVGTPDCDDGEAAVHPEADEVCNGIDDDCDGTCDVAPGSIDLDGDGLTSCGTVPGATCLGPKPQLVDCEDEDPEVHPGASEVCDGKENNCDGRVEDGEPCYVDRSGTCRLGVRACDDDDSDGLSGLEDCLAVDASPVVAPGFCTSYAECEDATPPPPDLFECANDSEATANKFKCDLFYQPGLELCPERRAVLPIGPPAQNCKWRLLGGFEQTHYDVALFDRFGVGGPQESLGDCSGQFAVLDKNDFLPRPDSVYLEYSDDNSSARALEVQITPVMVGQCPVDAGLRCQLSP